MPLLSLMMLEPPGSPITMLVSKHFGMVMRTSDATEWTLGVADNGSGGTPDAGLFSDMALDSQGYPVSRPL